MSSSCLFSTFKSTHDCPILGLPLRFTPIHTFLIVWRQHYNPGVRHSAGHNVELLHAGVTSFPANSNSNLLKAKNRILSPKILVNLTLDVESYIKQTSLW